MTDNNAIARPYAEAVYALARDGGKLDAWAGQLDLLGAVMGDERLRVIEANPRVERAALADLVCGICGDRLDETVRNLVHLLAENRRLPALPELARQFNQLKAEAEKVIEAEAAAPYELSEQEISGLARALSERWGGQVRVTARLDPDLIGGVLVRAGDRVIDGSVQGKLREMASHLNR